MPAVKENSLSFSEIWDPVLSDMNKIVGVTLSNLLLITPSKQRNGPVIFSTGFPILQSKLHKITGYWQLLVTCIIIWLNELNLMDH